ncbi:MAG: hypothetical protein BWZ10_00929 [candidate division BRC1 bacterium ADurb.BinA364]|nr:MAG: hypothetical protein BWZ10_00929 [candidate division BRC1 bacterium ADurb.BinA364]
MPLQRAIEAMRAEAANSLNARRPRPAEEAEAFRAVARAWRYPRLSAANARFASILDSIGLPSGCVIEPPAHFEGRAYRFVCSFSDPARLPETLRLAASRLEAGCALRQFVERGE